MLNIEFDTLWQRQRRRMIRNLILRISLAAIVSIGIGLAWYANTPYDTVIRLDEHSFHNDSLPFKTATIRMVIGKDTITKEIENINDQAVFRNIPRRYMHHSRRLWFESYGYMPVDTTIVPKPNTVIQVNRDNTYGVYQGVVMDCNGNRLEGVTVTIDSLFVLTNEKGEFSIEFPLDQQTVKKHITACKSGYKMWEYDGAPSKKFNHQILIER